MHQFLSGLKDVAVLEASGDESETALDHGVVSQLFSRAPADSRGGALNDRLMGATPAGAFGVGAELLGVLGSSPTRSMRWLRWSTASDDGLAHAEVAVSLAEDTDRAWELPFIHAVASYFHAGRGNWRFAAEHAEAARLVAEVAPMPVSRHYVRVAAGHWVRGDWDAVLHSLAPLHEGPPAIGMAGIGQRVPWLLKAEAMIRTGRFDEATRVLSKIDRAMDENPNDLSHVDLWRLRGTLDHARRRPAKPRAAFLEGQAAVKTADSPPAQATLELAYGQFLQKTGSRRVAVRALRVARELFERLGVRPFLERRDVELAACGVRARARGTDDDYGLTGREQLVASLVASGKSNREVAAELFLSSKAVEYHLANIFTKVGIRSRHELASRLRGANMPAPRQDALVGADPR